ncbi:uncharacterized protein B0H64DRAFT_462757 [Chaetomium fimeti]|uniref:Uncharacterized protein n=1 Tax=Chaetomium fimeti TaxID=1854472 RepID=A0AAE0LR32_9PEZI|nr:hypothetical protein B0H64DRAFT_462757 [Chaetomium fimeti]
MVFFFSLVAVLAFAAVTVAFGTINDPIVLKQHNEHEMITRLAFQCPSDQKSDGNCFEPRSLDQLAGYHNNVLGIALTGTGTNGAVGAPDTFDPLPEGPEAHCDDADFLDVPGYPRTRDEANSKLQACVDHLRHRFRQAVGAAKRMLDDRNRVRRDMVQLYGGDCTFAFPGWQSDDFGRAKCSALEGFGRALHGIQDFYAHSNWADDADPTQPISVANPPGLGMDGTASFLDLRANGTIPPDEIPRNLTTGCFNLPDITYGVGVCQGRVTHGALSKDKGVIHLDGTFGLVELDPRSQAVSTNFKLAVRAAVQHSREVWASLRDEIRLQYGTVSGDLMICSLIRDNPVKDCRNRTMAVALDNSLASEANGGIEMEKLLAEEVNSRLNTEGLDKIAVIENKEPAILRYPMGSPINVSFDLSPPSGQVCMASGLELGIAKTIHAQPETYADRGAIVLLTTSAEDPESIDSTLDQLRRAAEEGIRVHYACIDMHTNTAEVIPDKAKWAGCTPGDSLVSPVLKTALAGFLSPDRPTKSFTYPLSAGENLEFTVSSVAANGQGAEACFGVTLWQNYPDKEIATHKRCGDSSPLLLRYEAKEPFDLVLEAEYGDTAPMDELLRREGILFVLAVDTNMPEKDETTIRTTTSIVSSSATVGTEAFLSSETLEVLSGTATVDSSTSTWTESFRVTDDGAFSFVRLGIEQYPMCSVPTITATAMVSNLTAGGDEDAA